MLGIPVEAKAQKLTVESAVIGRRGRDDAFKFPGQENQGASPDLKYACPGQFAGRGRPDSCPEGSRGVPAARAGNHPAQGPVREHDYTHTILTEYFGDDANAQAVQANNGVEVQGSGLNPRPVGFDGLGRVERGGLGSHSAFLAHGTWLIRGRIFPF